MRGRRDLSSIRPDKLLWGAAPPGTTEPAIAPLPRGIVSWCVAVHFGAGEHSAVDDVFLFFFRTFLSISLETKGVKFQFF